MDRRTIKNFITKRSSIWTLSLCLTGALTLGGIAWLDNTIRGDEKQQIENEAEKELDKFAEISDNTEHIEGMDLNSEEYDLAEASGNKVTNSSLMQEDVSDMDKILDEKSGEQTSDIMNESPDDTDDILSENTDDLISEQTNMTDNMSETTETAKTDNSSMVSEHTDMEDITDTAEVSGSAVISEQLLMDAGISFSDAETLLWPSAGTILIDYSMDSSVYFATLNQYKYNPALIIGSDVGNQVLASAAGIVESVFIDEETGTTLVMNIGNGYRLTYGQLKELSAAEGDIVEAGDVLGYVSEPTKYFAEEGSNLYFGMTYEGEAVDPVLYLEG